MKGSELELGNCSCLTREQLDQIFPSASDSKKQSMLDVFNQYCNAFEINTPLRVGHFFAQIKAEVGPHIDYKTENLNYSASRLQQVFGYFKHHPQEAYLYGRTKDHGANQEAIANRVYANRIGNGSIASGDGWRYRGRGFIQLTGKANYRTANNEIQSHAPDSGVDIINNPDSILTMKGAMLASMGYWTAHNLNSVADSAGWSSADRVADVVNRYTDARSARNENLREIKGSLGQ